MSKIKINDTFSIEQDSSCWVLTIRKKGYSKKEDKEIISEREIYPATFIQCCVRMIDMSVGNARDIKDIKDCMINCKNEILKAIGGNDIGGYPINSERVESPDRGSKREHKGNENNNPNENERTERKVSTGNSTESKQVGQKRGRRTRTTKT